MTRPKDTVFTGGAFYIGVEVPGKQTGLVLELGRGTADGVFAAIEAIQRGGLVSPGEIKTRLLGAIEAIGDFRLFKPPEDPLAMPEKFTEQPKGPTGDEQNPEDPLAHPAEFTNKDGAATSDIALDEVKSGLEAEDEAAEGETASRRSKR